MRLLFIHIPRIGGGRREIMVMPMGLIPLAALAVRRGAEARIIHAGLGGKEDPETLLRSIESYGADCVLFSLHWHQQIEPVTAAIRLVSEHLPGVTIVAGGLTASVYALELLRDLPMLTAVIMGDAEGAIGAIAEGGREIFNRPAGVPNLAYRDIGGRIRTPGIAYVLDRRRSRVLEHARFDLMEDAEEYRLSRLYADFADPPGGISPDSYGSAFYYNPGRGCPYRCPFCGGSSDAQKVTTGRIGYFFYDREKIVSDLDAAWDAGYRTWRVCFDPDHRRRSWLSLLGRLSRARRRFRIVFDAWTPATDLLAEGLAAAGARGTTLVLSPETGSERLRKRLKGDLFTDGAIERSVSSAIKAGLGVHLFFSAGLPRETEEDLEMTRLMIASYRRRWRCGISVCPLLLDPASPMQRFPRRYGIVPRWCSLSSYGDRGLAPGYDTRLMSHDKIMKAVEGLQEAAWAALVRR